MMTLVIGAGLIGSKVARILVERGEFQTKTRSGCSNAYGRYKRETWQSRRRALF